MINRISRNNGYVGLLALLIGMVIIVFVVWKFSFFTAKNEDQKNINADVGVDFNANVLEQNRQAIKQAELLKEKLEKKPANNRRMNIFLKHK